jgi:hypothetical protein
MENKIKALAAAIVVAHAAIAVVHGAAHTRLEIDMSRLSDMFIIIVIMIGPFVALGLIIAGRLQAGYWLLFATMAGSLLFGAWNHFVVESPDHVAHVAEGTWGTIFQFTAYLLSLSEAAGCAIGVWGATALKKALTANPA